MIYLGLFLVEIYTLFFLSRRVQQAITRMFFTLTKNRKATFYMLSIVFLPGTLIHELSHAIFSIFLLVPVGDLVFIPEIDEDTVRLGSVGIAKTDPLRRFLIGIAPLIVGVTLILFSVYYLAAGRYTSNISVAAILYIIFEIGNTMFLSQKDMEGAWKIFLAAGIIYLIYFLSGVSININLNDRISYDTLFEKASLYMGLPLLIDFAIIAIFRLRK